MVRFGIGKMKYGKGCKALGKRDQNSRRPIFEVRMRG